MNAKVGIPIRVVENRAPPKDYVLGGGLTAVLHEILALLENLSAFGEGGQIDLRSLPMAPGEHDDLKNALGEGEVDVTLNLGGPTRCRETAYPGVWWVEHKDPAGATVAEFIEIAFVPELLRPEDEDIRAGVRRLEQRLRAGHATTGGNSP